jgi:hypothetical protein
MMNPLARREFFRNAGTGLASMALASLMAEDSAVAAPRDWLAAHPGHHAPKAKNVIWLFMEGGPSHVDLFDPKPKLNELHGQPLPASYGKLITAMGTANNAIMGSPRKWKQHGQAGTWVSDWYPKIANHVDDIAVLRSCWANGLNHVGSVCQMNTGDILAGRPSMGAWVTYGLGASNRNLPTFVTLLDDREPVGGPKNWSSGFLPAVYQGTQFRQGDTPILHLASPKGVTNERQRSKLDFLKVLNDRWGADKSEDFDLDGPHAELRARLQDAGRRA